MVSHYTELCFLMCSPLPYLFDTATKPKYRTVSTYNYQHYSLLFIIHYFTFQNKNNEEGKNHNHRTSIPTGSIRHEVVEHEMQNFSLQRQHQQSLKAIRHLNVTLSIQEYGLFDQCFTLVRTGIPCWFAIDGVLFCYCDVQHACISV